MAGAATAVPPATAAATAAAAGLSTATFDCALTPLAVQPAAAMLSSTKLDYPLNESSDPAASSGFANSSSSAATGSHQTNRVRHPHSAGGHSNSSGGRGRGSSDVAGTSVGSIGGAVQAAAQSSARPSATAHSVSSTEPDSSAASADVRIDIMRLGSGVRRVDAAAAPSSITSGPPPAESLADSVGRQQQQQQQQQSEERVAFAPQPTAPPSASLKPPAAHIAPTSYPDGSETPTSSKGAGSLATASASSLPLPLLPPPCAPLQGLLAMRREREAATTAAAAVAVAAAASSTVDNPMLYTAARREPVDPVVSAPAVRGPARRASSPHPGSGSLNGVSSSVASLSTLVLPVRVVLAPRLHD